MNGNIENMQSLTGRIKGLGIDKTLTKKGMCAEAEATGKALATKVSITDIVDDVLSVATDKPLSANQGRLLKKQIDEIDPHNAENVIYGDTNVKNAIDKLSKAENISYDEEKSVQGAIDELSKYTGLVKSKNLLINIAETKSYNGGGTVTVNKDKSITINGTFTDSNTIVHLDSKNNNLELGKEYVASISKVDVGITFNVTFYTSGSTTVDCGSTNTSINFTTPSAIYLNRLFLSIPSGTYDNVTIYPMISVDGGEYEPYVADVQTQLNTIFTSVDYTIQTTSNSSASPYTKYGELDISSHINAYGTPISINASNSSGIPVPCSYSTGSKKMKVCSNLGEIYAKIVYVKIPVTAK